MIAMIARMPLIRISAYLFPTIIPAARMRRSPAAPARSRLLRTPAAAAAAKPADMLTALSSLSLSIDSLAARVSAHTHPDALVAEAHSLEQSLRDQDIWIKDAKTAIETQRRISRIQSILSQHNAFLRRKSEADAMLDLVREEPDPSLLADVLRDHETLESDLRSHFVKSLMTEEADAGGCYIEVRAGAGGVESCDWVSMITRMYLRWAEQQSYQAKLMDEVRGDVAGLKESVIQVTGDYAYGYTKHETGVHRFVRISPFDANGKRHTSFVSVQVIPAAGCEDDGDGDGGGGGGSGGIKGITIPASELKVEVMRAQGAGGQHVNKTESAVRLVHLPTGITVFCQSERSQIRNKAMAMQMLKSKLYKRELDAKAKAKADNHANLSDSAWGNQIRSYVLQPYQLIKDARTGYQRGDVQNVLDGDLNGLMESLLMHHAPKK